MSTGYARTHTHINVRWLVTTYFGEFRVDRNAEMVAAIQDRVTGIVQIKLLLAVICSSFMMNCRLNGMAR